LQPGWCSRAIVRLDNDPKLLRLRVNSVELLPVGVVASVGSYTFGMVTLFPATMTATGAGAMMQPEVLPRENAMYSRATRSNMVVGVDGSPASDAAVRWAAREAMMRVVPIKLINVVAPTLVSSAMAPNHTITQGEERQARQILKQARRIVEELAGEKPPEIHTQRQYAGVVPTLVDASNDAQMVVVGSSGRAFGRGMLGSVIAGCSTMRTCAHRYRRRAPASSRLS
jgi:nucleotide-binding universal stress UspA family protein